MKLYELQAIAKRLGKFTTISRARRTEDNTIEITFEKNDSYLFNLTRGHSTICKAPSQRPLQGYNAPFDMLLHNLLSGSKLLEASISQNDRILRFKVAPRSSYKDQIVYLQMEFTGKNTNAILIDENEVVIEALRHIDAQSSFRIIRPGVELLAVPPLERKETPQSIEDIDVYLETIYGKIQEKKVAELKKQKCSQIEKKIQKLEQLLAQLPSPDTLKEEEAAYKNYANIILANLYQIGRASCRERV